MSIHPRDAGWYVTLVVGAAAILVAAGVVLTRLATPTELAVIPTETWPWTSAGVGVDPISPESQFRAGDLVVAMDGHSMAAWVEGAVPFGAGGETFRLGRIVTFDVIRDGAPTRLTVALQAYPPATLAGAPALVVYGGGALLLGLLLLVRRPRATALRLLFVAAAANTADIVAWGIGLQPTDFGTGSPFLFLFATAALCNVLFWSSILHLLAIYPARSPLVARHGILVALIYAGPIAALLGLAAADWLTAPTTLEGVARLANVMGTVASGMVLLIFVATLAAYRRAPASTRRGLRPVGVALGISAAVTFALLTLPIALTGVPLVSRQILSLVALSVPLAIAVSAARDQIFQVSLLTRSRERIVAAREDERRKLRRELHDGLAPALAAAALKIDLARAAARSKPDEADRLLIEAGQGVRGAIGDIRRVSRELRPPALDSLGLVGAIRQQADGLGVDSAGTLITVDAPDALPPLPAAVEVAAYRIAVEGMVNVVRHAGAGTCTVQIALGDDELQVVVDDDGAGLAGETGVGTRSMRERAAEVGGVVVIEQSRDRGTRLFARLPVDLSELGGAPA